MHLDGKYMGILFTSSESLELLHSEKFKNELEMIKEKKYIDNSFEKFGYEGE